MAGQPARVPVALVVLSEAPAKRRRRPVCSLDDRALALWPRLDRRALARCHCDARRIAAYVARRTSLPFESILLMLTQA